MERHPHYIDTHTDWHSQLMQTLGQALIEVGSTLTQLSVQLQATPEPTAREGDTHELEAQLLPFFKGDETQVCRFVAAIRQAQPGVVTTLVNTLVKDCVIIKDLAGKPLWEALHTHGLYPLSYQNWNKMLI